MTALARFGWSQELGTQYRSPMWVTETQLPEPRLKARHSDTGCGCPRCHPNPAPNACPHLCSTALALPACFLTALLQASSPLRSQLKDDCLSDGFSIYSSNCTLSLLLTEFPLQPFSHTASHHSCLSLLSSSLLFKGSGHSSFISESLKHVALCHILRKMCSSFVK